MYSHRRLGGILIALFVPFAVWAGALVLPFTFQPGTPIRASEMNDNFAAIKQAVDDLDARVSQGGNGLVRSGTRLKTLTIEGPDGFSSPVVTYSGHALYVDTQLQTVCIANAHGYDPRSHGFCVPHSYAVLAYGDANCQVPVIAKYAENLLLPFSGDAGTREFARGPQDGGFEFREAGAYSADAGFVYDSFEMSTVLPDGGRTTTTVCRLNTQPYLIAPIVRTIGVNDLAPVTYQFR